MLAATGWVASREWFSGDDFAFLAHVAQPDRFHWGAVWLPFGERFWPFYRPLGMDTYFRLGFDVFGLSAPGFFAVTLAVHFARACLVARLARQLGCDRATACVGGLLALGGGASLPVLYAGSIFHYVLASLAVTLCVSLFLDAGRESRSRAALGAVFATGVALLCNESAVVLPALLVVAALLEARSVAPRAWLRAARRVAPHAALVALYFALRFGALAEVGERALYAPALDAHVLSNAAAQIALAGRGGVGVAALALLAAAGGFALRRPGAASGDLARGGLLCLAWIAIALLPFIALPFPHARFSIGIEAPLALLAALALAAILRALPERRRRAFAVAALALPLFAFPWAPLLERGRHPEGELPRRLVAWIAERAAWLPDRSRVVVLYGVEGLADVAAGERLRYLAYNGQVAAAVWPDQRVSVRFHDLNQRMPRAVARADAVYVALLPDLTLAAPPPGLLDRELPRSFAGADSAAASE